MEISEIFTADLDYQDNTVRMTCLRNSDGGIIVYNPLSKSIYKRAQNLIRNKDREYLASLNEIHEALNFINKYKEGDYITVRYERGDKKNYWMNNTEDRTFKITGPISVYIGGYMYKTELGGVDIDKNVRLATIAEIEAINSLPKVNGYTGSISLDKKTVDYGCAKISVEFFKGHLNRYIKHMTLSSGVFIDKSSMDAIRNALEREGII
ncbi:hypothetical protein Phi40:1_gp039 [Cellulophaga phage phi40:1]|uniref:Uncharacterized protein n=1 Tax=Cellulophaga phage phi38:1 TaxID=1327977 RepID=R9ZXU5_9CAUD|nr:hypothetical protein Phi38:1_gp039 [Cellulophaga phage phi38:1]AGO47904.1 hypothetical protein Phi40:1_gp039 [Cellulophaga phage phi40:1]AGO48069.1 hypothetical protein Phi38:1_gp039 [Cellulophaga phage phi38:1]|tara:strand:- start:454 stop:1080 length:627 start_codon:yes stop_codon:yes gene_type:complete